jgi:hypothetical protein
MDPEGPACPEVSVDVLAGMAAGRLRPWPLSASEGRIAEARSAMTAIKKRRPRDGR